MSSLKAAVIGYGHLGKYHAEKIQSMKAVDLFAICDLNLDSAREKFPHIILVENFVDLPEDLDLIWITCSTPYHYEVAKHFLKKGKSVFVEKPLTETVEQAKELCHLAKVNSCLLQVGHVERFNPALLSAQEKLGQPLFIEGHRIAPFKPRSMDVDVVLDLMIHDIDVVLTLMKSKVTKVSGVGTPVLTPHVDIANARLEFENKAVVNLTASRVSQKSERKFRVFQKDQYLSIDFALGQVNLTTKTGALDSLDGDLPLEFESWNLEKGDALMAEDMAFVNSFLTQAPALVPGEEGLLALEVAERIRADIASRI